MIKRCMCVLGVTVMLAACDARDSDALAVVAMEKEGTDRTSDLEWMRVLELASSDSPEARDQLRRVAAIESDAPSAGLARKLLELWDESRNTYVSDRPRLLGLPKLPLDELRKIFPDRTEAGVVAVKVQVDADGAVAGVAILTAPDNPALKELAIRHTKDLLFCPVRGADGYKAGEAVLTYRFEVR